MVHDPGMGLPRKATADDFTLSELSHIDMIKKGTLVPWRGEMWRVTQVDPLELVEVLDEEMRK